jgi:hypothetical protein
VFEVGLIPHSSNVIWVDVVSLSSPHDQVTLRMLVSLPETYPTSSAPQLQLLSKYIGDFGVDHGLFGLVLRMFISASGARWSPDNVCVFDGVQNVLDRCLAWYEERLSDRAAAGSRGVHAIEGKSAPSSESPITQADYAQALEGPSSHLPEDVQIFEAEAIRDRKSAFVGRACRISHPSQVNPFISYFRLTSSSQFTKGSFDPVSSHV